MSNRIKKKFIDSNAVDGSKLRLLNSESVRAKKKNSDDDVNLFKLNDQDQLEFQVIPKLSQNPATDDDLVRKAYIDGKVAQEASDRAAAISAEEAARQTAISNEASARSAADAVEQSSRISGDKALSDRLDILEADPVTKTYVDNKDSSEKSAREAADSALNSRVSVLEADPVTKSYVDSKDSSEKSAREAADLALSGRVEALEADPVTKSYVDGKDSSEKSAREAADSALSNRVAALEADPVTKSYVDAQDSAEASARSSAISALKGAVSSDYDSLKKIEDKIKNVISNTDPAALDSLSEIVDAFQHADSDLISSLNALSSSSSSAIAAEKAAREAADSALSGRVASLEADPVTKSYVDSKDSSEKSDREAADSALSGRLAVLEADPVTKSYVDGKDSSEKSAREAADSALSSRVAVLEADPVTKSYVDSKDASEKSDRQAADSALSGRLAVLEADPVTKSYVDGKVLTINNDLDSLDAYAQDIRGDLDQEISDRAAADSAEQAARIGGDSALQSSLTNEIASRQAADSTLDSKIDSKFSDSKAYTDSKIAALVNSAPAVLDTLKELSDALGGDANFATSVTNQIATSSNNVGTQFKKESFVVDSAMISTGYIDLSSKAFADSIILTNARLMMLVDEDYSVSLVNGKTRLTFMGSMLPMGEEALEVGDKLRVSYLKDIRA